MVGTRCGYAHTALYALVTLAHGIVVSYVCALTYAVAAADDVRHTLVVVAFVATTSAFVYEWRAYVGQRLFGLTLASARLQLVAERAFGVHACVAYMLAMLAPLCAFDALPSAPSPRAASHAAPSERASPSIGALAAAHVALSVTLVAHIAAHATIAFVDRRERTHVRRNDAIALDEIIEDVSDLSDSDDDGGARRRSNNHSR